MAPEMPPVDPRALGELLVQVRALLRHHQRIGIRAYPEKQRFAHLFTGQARQARPAATAGQEKEAVLQPAEHARPAPHLDAVHEELRRCQACARQHGPIMPARPRRHPVPLVVVGDWCRANGTGDEWWCDRDEDNMLARMMKAIEVDMDSVYTTNVVKCCVADDAARREAVQRCCSHLHREIAAVQSGIVLAMGELAASILLGAEHPLVRLRGRMHRRVFAGHSVQVMPTFHPHFLLQHEGMKKLAWQDLLAVQRYLARNPV